jgi:hypothetical protein
MSIIGNKTSLIIIFGVAVFLSGCAFSSTAKKTEINLKENSTAEEANNEKKTAPENSSETAKPNNTIQNSQSKTADPISEEPKKDSNEPVPSFKIIDRLVNWGYTKASGRKINTIIIHSTYNAVGSDPHGLDDIINKEYKLYGVSPHYIIPRDGKIYRLVEDKNIAYHAGESKTPDGRTNVNDFSIGIEIINTKSESPSSAQYGSLKNLIGYLKEKYQIRYVLGHSDIAPGRKDDPWNLDWKEIK